MEYFYITQKYDPKVDYTATNNHKNSNNTNFIKINHFLSAAYYKDRNKSFFTEKRSVLPPEYEQKEYTYKGDIFQLGLILYSLITDAGIE